MTQHLPILAQRLLDHANGHPDLALHIAQDIVVGDVLGKEGIDLAPQLVADIWQGALRRLRDGRGFTLLCNSVGSRDGLGSDGVVVYHGGGVVAGE